jgi:hypothetical protein
VNSYIRAIAAITFFLSGIPAHAAESASVPAATAAATAAATSATSVLRHQRLIKLLIRQRLLIV